MAEKKVILTREGLDKLEAELNELKTTRRKDVAEKIKEARGQGDLSENAEYDSAKEEQAEIEARIIQVESVLRNAEVIDDEGNDHSKVNLGTKVKIHDYDLKEDITYTIVGSVEADPLNGKISNECLLGQHLIGKSVGDEFSYSSDIGEEKFKVIEIY